MLIQFTIHGTPVGKGRPRATKTGRMYTPEKTARAEESFLAQALPFKPATPITGPVAMVLRFIFPVPASYSKKRRDRCLAGEEWPTKKPDGSNILKLVEDALNEVFYVDDAQIVFSEINKEYGENPGIKVTMWELDDEREA